MNHYVVYYMGVFVLCFFLIMCLAMKDLRLVTGCVFIVIALSSAWFLYLDLEDRRIVQISVVAILCLLSAHVAIEIILQITKRQPTLFYKRGLLGVFYILVYVAIILWKTLPDLWKPEELPIYIEPSIPFPPIELTSDGNPKTHIRIEVFFTGAHENIRRLRNLQRLKRLRITQHSATDVNDNPTLREALNKYLDDLNSSPSHVNTMSTDNFDVFALIEQAPDGIKPIRATWYYPANIFLDDNLQDLVQGQSEGKPKLWLHEQSPQLYILRFGLSINWREGIKKRQNQQ